jgi:OOP family OmpA-OmpF porin
MKRLLVVLFVACAKQTAPVEIAGNGTLGPLPSAVSAPLPPPAISPLAVSSAGELILPSPIYFRTASNALLPDADAALQRVVEFLRVRTDVTLLRVEVHSDSTGAASYNLALSQKRANAVGKWLVDHGADCSRLDAVGYGDTRPIAPNSTEEGRGRNRRTVFAVVAAGTSARELC